MEGQRYQDNRNSFKTQPDRRLGVQAGYKITNADAGQALALKLQRNRDPLPVCTIWQMVALVGRIKGIAASNRHAATRMLSDPVGDSQPDSLVYRVSRQSQVSVAAYLWP